jgi:hypothetical protein
LQSNPIFIQKVKEHLTEGSKAKLLDKYNYRSYVQLLESNFDKQRPAQVANRSHFGIADDPQFGLLKQRHYVFNVDFQNVGKN